MWRAGREEWERKEVRKKLQEIEQELKPGRAIYFEDPFGKTRYERSEALEREIGTFLESIEQTENVYVIITSREEIFKEFEKEHLSSVELRNFEKKLNIKRPSYDYEKRKEILFRWAESKSCKWLFDHSLVNTILEYIKDRRKLPTPLSIRDFVYSSISLVEEFELLKKIEDKSKETARSFAKEVENMSDDKILFLLFPFISNFRISFVKSKYEKLAKKLKEQKPWEFERTLEWFKDDKVTIYNNRIAFSHPSYYEALEYLLVEKGRPTRINRDLYSKVLLELLENDNTVDIAAVEIAYNFDKVSEKLRDLFFKLFENEKVVDMLTERVAEDFEGLSDQVKGGLLLKLAKNDISLPWVVAPIIRNYNALPKEVRNLLFELPEDQKTVELVVLEIVYNFNRAPKEVRNLLFKISERPEVQSILKTALEDYDMLTEETKDELLLKLAESRKTAPAVSSTLTLNFDNIPVDIRNELLLRLSKKDIGLVALDIVFHFDKLPHEIRNLLFELPIDDETADYLAEALLGYFDELPNTLRNRLTAKLAENDSTAWLMGWAITENYNKLPENVRGLLFLIAENQKAAEQVARAIKHYFDRLPSKVRKLLDRLPTSHLCTHENGIA